jgi:hypothetical protein
MLGGNEVFTTPESEFVIHGTYCELFQFVGVSGAHRSRHR